MSEVTKQQAQNTRHRYRLFARLDQAGEDRDGLDDVDDVLGPDGKRIKVENETPIRTENTAENPDEIQIDDSSDEETDVKPKKEKKSEEKDEEQEDEPEQYDPYMDPNLDDIDDVEIQEARQMGAPDSY